MFSFVQKKKFLILYLCLLSISILGSLWLGVKIEQQSPEILKLVEINGDINDAQVYDQRLVFKTNRIIDNKTLSGIEVIPEANFIANSYENKLVISFTDPLKSDQVYNINFSTTLKDVYGKSFKQKRFKFKTSKLHIAFLDVDRKILKKSTPDLEKIEIIFQSEFPIKHYELSDEKLVLVVEGDNASYIYLVSPNKLTSVELTQKIINSLTASDNLEKIFFVAGEASFVEGEIYPKDKNKLYELDFETGIYNAVSLDNGVFSDVVDAMLVPDGSAVLIKNVDSSFFLVNTLDYSDYIDLGKYLDVTDFNRDKNVYLAVESPFGAAYASFPYITLIDSNSNKKALTKGDIYVLDPKFWEDNVIYASRVNEIEGSRGFFGISVLDGQTLESKELLKIENKSVELPIVSPDLMYIAVEIYTQDELKSFENLRNKGFQAKPGSAEIGIFDVKSGKLIRNDVVGIEAKWFF
jgi:hypothetical protein